MTLPTIKTPIKKIKLSNGESIQYRGFTGKEEDILLQAKEEGSRSVQYDAVEQIITNCTFNKINVGDLKTIDIEKLFIAIRSNSVGNIVNLSFVCKKESSDGSECGKPINITVDLNNTEYPPLDADMALDFHIDDVIVTLKEPNLEALSKQEENKDYRDVIFFFDKIIQGEDVFDAKDFSLDELQEWSSSLPFDTLTEMAKTIDRFPKAQQTINFSCVCGNEGEYTIRGINSFFM